MATPVEAVAKKTELVQELWTAKKVEELLAVAYTSDATFTSGGDTSKGHDELLKSFNEHINDNYVVKEINGSAASDDCVVQTVKATLNGADVTGKITWRKVSGDWKICSEDWN